MTEEKERPRPGKRGARAIPGETSKPSQQQSSGRNGKETLNSGPRKRGSRLKTVITHANQKRGNSSPWRKKHFKEGKTFHEQKKGKVTKKKQQGSNEEDGTTKRGRP